MLVLLRSANRLRRGRCALARGVGAIALATACLGAGVGGVAAALETSPAITSAEARREAAAAIPLAKIAPQHRSAVSSVVRSASVFRRLPTNVIDCDPRMFTYFAENPASLVAIWKHMGLCQLELQPLGEGKYRLSDGAGTTGTIEVVEQTCDEQAQNRVVLLAHGAYEGKPFKESIGARCVFLLRSGSVVETNGRTYVAARLDSFVKFDRPTLDILAKAAHPFVGRTADQNFADTLSFVSNLSYTAQVRPEAVQRLAEDSGDLAEPQRQRLVAVIRQCAESAAPLEVTRAEGPIVRVAAPR